MNMSVIEESWREEPWREGPWREEPWRGTYRLVCSELAVKHGTWIRTGIEYEAIDQIYDTPMILDFACNWWHLHTGVGRSSIHCAHHAMQLSTVLDAEFVMNESMLKEAIYTTQTSKEEGNRPLLSKPPRRICNSSQS